MSDATELLMFFRFAHMSDATELLMFFRARPSLATLHS